MTCIFLGQILKLAYLLELDSKQRRRLLMMQRVMERTRAVLKMDPVQRLF